MTELTIVGRLQRHAAGRPGRKNAAPASTESDSGPDPQNSQAPPDPPASRIARNLALSYKLDELIVQGQLRDLAHAAATLGISRARATQLANLRFLDPGLQTAILLHQRKVSERALRDVLKDPIWPAARGTA